MNKDILYGNEKIIVWIAIIINPIIAGCLFYYMWRRSFPNKAKQANRVSFFVAGVEILLIMLYKFFI